MVTILLFLSNTYRRIYIYIYIYIIYIYIYINYYKLLYPTDPEKDNFATSLTDVFVVIAAESLLWQDAAPGSAKRRRNDPGRPSLGEGLVCFMGF